MRGRTHQRKESAEPTSDAEEEDKVKDTQIHDKLRHTLGGGGGAEGGDACCTVSACARTSPSALWGGCQVPGEMTGSSVFQRHHEANSNGTIIFCRKRSGRPHSQLGRRGCCPGRRLMDFLGPQPPPLRQPAHRAVTGLPRRNLLGTGQPVRCPSAPCTSPAHPHPLSWSARPRP